MMKATSTDLCEAYVAGALHGDAYCTTKSGLGLRVKDRDFAKTFALAARRATGRRFSVRADRDFWLTRCSDRRGLFANLRAYEPVDDDELGMWLRGLFDSEGNAHIGRVKHKRNSFYRRIAIYSTNGATLDRAARYFDWLGIAHSVRNVKPSRGHIGKKPVFELRVTRQDGFVTFADRVGSSIGRKRRAIHRIVATYQPPGWQARNWQKAVAARWPK